MPKTNKKEPVVLEITPFMRQLVGYYRGSRTKACSKAWSNACAIALAEYTANRVREVIDRGDEK